ncbi:MAG: DUF1223 domain-containing protein [Hyphomicrobium sp.]|uniref:DUF1223 domain-containing protein n=1 Tax=Hyphomicrobium sp. TaxID=82 RepID=UPI0022CBC710|nr:DUF1223 domain-containing protein [Hyphomicrobium sp.]MBZ0209447.1 DUF1223 domain-containing protein [Hyphomicrobium sp.]MCZ7593964.1 DUF1223 domain-containing protein [Hyphomicrobium sp.]
MYFARMRLAPFVALTLALFLPASGALTQDAPGINPSFGPPKDVLELFTSQGCDTCPPADQVLAKFADRPNIIAITLPVDIWDYLGWKDTLASDKNSERQRAYAKARGDGAIYTPQVVVNGMIGVNGSDPAAIEEAIKVSNIALAGARVPIRFWHERNSIKIEAGDAPPGRTYKEATIWFAVVQKRTEVPIERGDNKGRTLAYTNIVREMLPVGSWNGKALSLQLTRTAVMRPETEAAIILLQEGKAGPIIGAAWTGLW